MQPFAIIALGKNEWALFEFTTNNNNNNNNLTHFYHYRDRIIYYCPRQYGNTVP